LWVPKRWKSSVGKDVEKRNTICTVGGMKTCTVWTFLEKLKIDLPYDPGISLVTTCSKYLKPVWPRDICITSIIATLFTTVKTQRYLFPSMKKWIYKCVCTQLKAIQPWKYRKNCHLQQMYEPQGNCIKWNETETEQQKWMLLTAMWKLKTLNSQK
jgi:hypothetical protein